MKPCIVLWEALEIHQSWLFEWTGLSGLWSRSCTGDLATSICGSKFGGTVFCRHDGNDDSGIHHIGDSGKAVPHEMVGLFQIQISDQRPGMFAEFLDVRRTLRDIDASTASLGFRDDWQDPNMAAARGCAWESLRFLLRIHLSLCAPSLC